MSKYHMTFIFCDTEEDAKQVCNTENASGSYYKRTHYKAHYTPWQSLDGKENKFVCFTYYR